MENVENAVLEQLREANVSDRALKNTSKAFAALRKTDFAIYKILVNGTPHPEWVIVKGRLPLDRFEALKPLWGNELLRDIRLFPYGIINPEGFDVRVRFNTNGAHI